MSLSWRDSLFPSSACLSLLTESPVPEARAAVSPGHAPSFRVRSVLGCVFSLFPGVTDGTGGQEQSGLEMKLGHQQSDTELCAHVCVGVCAHTLVLKLRRLGAHRSPLPVEGPSPSQAQPGLSSGVGVGRRDAVELSHFPRTTGVAEDPSSASGREARATGAEAGWGGASGRGGCGAGLLDSGAVGVCLGCKESTVLSPQFDVPRTLPPPSLMDCPQVAGKLDVSSWLPGSFHPQRAPRAGETTGRAPRPSSELPSCTAHGAHLVLGCWVTPNGVTLGLGHGGIHPSTLALTALSHKHVGGAADRDSVAMSVCSCLSIISHCVAFEPQGQRLATP